MLGFTRPAAAGGVLVLANFSEAVQNVQDHVLSALPASAVDLIDGRRHDLRGGLSLKAYQMVWLDLSANTG